MAGIGIALVATLGMILAIMATMAPSAHAQLPSACEEYPDLEICIGPTDEESAGDDQGPGVDGGNNPSANNGDGNGSLPFTGYPLTSLILLLLALLVIGLTVRAYAAVRERLRDDASAG